MAEGMEVLETALYSKLSGFAGLTALVGSQIYDTQAPANTTGDYVIFQHAAGGEDNESPREGITAMYRIEGVSKIQANARAIASQIKLALHHQEMIITGWSNYSTDMMDLFNRVDNVAGIQWWRKGGIYRIRISKNVTGG